MDCYQLDIMDASYLLDSFALAHAWLGILEREITPVRSISSFSNFNLLQIVFC